MAFTFWGVDSNFFTFVYAVPSETRTKWTDFIIIKTQLTTTEKRCILKVWKSLKPQTWVQPWHFNYDNETECQHSESHTKILFPIIWWIYIAPNEGWFSKMNAINPHFSIRYQKLRLFCCPDFNYSHEGFHEILPSSAKPLHWVISIIQPGDLF